MRLVISDFVTRKNIKDPKLLDKPAGILSKIIFESKSEPWWIYVNALSNYVAWLYTHLESAVSNASTYPRHILILFCITMRKWMAAVTQEIIELVGDTLL